jgi:hypothetical protein
MKTYEIKIEGVSSCIQNKLSRDLIKENKKIPNEKKEDWEDENYEKKLYTNRDGEVIWPAINIHGMILAAAKSYKVPAPKSIGKTWTNYIKACVIIPNESVIKYKEINKLGCMVNGNPSSGKKSSKVYKARPEIIDWSLTITMIDSEGFMNKETVTEILTQGGKFIGLSDWRPQYGRFKVLSVKEI